MILAMLIIDGREFYCSITTLSTVGLSHIKGKYATKPSCTVVPLDNNYPMRSFDWQAAYKV